MKIAHQTPIILFPIIQSMTEFDCCLVHLFETNVQYRRCFMQAMSKGRSIMLDNSVFELGTPWPEKEFARVIEILHPNEYIIPDVLNECSVTIKKMKYWKSEFKLIQGASIGVSQGKTFDELSECYEIACDITEKVALSFDSMGFESLGDGITKAERYASGRIRFIYEMIDKGQWRFDVPTHLLGCAIPQELEAYRDIPNIESIDTSHPVVHGILGVSYTEKGLNWKAKTTINELLKVRPNAENVQRVLENVRIFRSLASDASSASAFV
jgi:hypothetical protein